MKKHVIGIVMIFVLLISATVTVNAADNVTNFSITKTKVNSTKYKVTVKATYPKNCTRRYMGGEAGPVFHKGIEFGSAKKSTSKTWSFYFTKDDYNKAGKNKSGKVGIYVWAGCECSSGYPVKGKVIYLKL